MEPVTVTEVRVTNDLQHATVYYTVLGDEATVAAAHEGIQENRGILRREVGRGLTIRLVPTLEFVADTVPGGRTPGGRPPRGQGAGRRAGEGARGRVVRR